MKGTLLFLLLTIVAALSAQNAPIDFEPDGQGADWTWTTFENDTNPPLEIVANPDPSGLNTSATVAKYTTLPGGMAFAGCETLHGAGIGSFTIDADNALIRISVWKSVISDVGIKLVRADNWSLGEIKIPNTVVDQWEQLEFDFSAHLGNTYDQLVIFPDFAARDEQHVIYFDDVYGAVATLSSTSAPARPAVLLSPNPVVDRIQIRSDLAWKHVRIFSAAGQLLRDEPLSAPSLDVSLLRAGMYVLELSNGQDRWVERWVKLNEK